MRTPLVDRGQHIAAGLVPLFVGMGFDFRKKLELEQRVRRVAILLWR